MSKKYTPNTEWKQLHYGHGMSRWTYCGLIKVCRNDRTTADDPTPWNISVFQNQIKMKAKTLEEGIIIAEKFAISMLQQSLLIFDKKDDSVSKNSSIDII